MKLFYFHHPVLRNFGDDLNPWLWEKLLPGVFTDSSDRGDDFPSDENRDDALFVGIGTILNDRLPPARRTVVFGSGVGYGDGLPRVDDSWKFYCVRGPLTAARLGLPKETAVTDAAFLLRCVWQPKSEKKWKRGYMPHVVEAERGGKSWQRICEDLDVRFVDPRWPLEKVLEEVAQCEVLYAEAMHGAIVADALRTPWVPVRTAENILPFKWEDWCRSVELEYRPEDVDPPLFRMGLSDAPADADIALRYRYKVKSRLTAKRFRRMLDRAKPTLSKEAVVQRLTDELESRLEQFRHDLSTGMFDAPYSEAVGEMAMARRSAT